MKKKFISVLLLIALCFSLSAPAYADSTTTFIQATNDLLASIAHATMHYAGLGIISDAISASDWSTYASNNFASWLSGVGGVLSDVTDLAWDGVRNRFILGSGVSLLINQYINSFVSDNQIDTSPVLIYPTFSNPVPVNVYVTSQYSSGFPAVYVGSDGLYFSDFYSGSPHFFRNDSANFNSYALSGESFEWKLYQVNSSIFKYRIHFPSLGVAGDFFANVSTSEFLSFTAFLNSADDFDNFLSDVLPTFGDVQYLDFSSSVASSPSDFSSAVYSGLADNSLSDIGVDISVGSAEPEPTDPPISGDLPQDIPNFAGRINDIADGVGGVTDTSSDNIFTRSGEKIHNWVEGLWDSFKTWLQQLLNSISSAFLTIWDNITSVLDDILDFLLGLFGVDNDFQDEFGGLIDGLSFGSIWHYVTSWIASISAFLGLLLSIWGNLPASMSIIVWASIALVIIFGVYHRFIS